MYSPTTDFLALLRQTSGGTAGSVGAIGGIWVKENYNTN
jgi:hypothetical protein